MAVADPVLLNPRAGGTVYHDDFTDAQFDSGWMAVRRTPDEVARTGTGELVLVADAEGLDDLHPALVCRRQSNIAAEASIEVDVSAGTGGLTTRYDENHHFDTEASATPHGTHVVARARLAGLQQEWHADVPGGPLTLRFTGRPNAQQLRLGDPVEQITFSAAPGADPTDVHVVAEIDGRYLSAEVVVAFTGRVLGPYANSGTVTVRDFRYRGSDA